MEPIILKSERHRIGVLHVEYTSGKLVQFDNVTLKEFIKFQGDVYSQAFTSLQGQFIKTSYVAVFEWKENIKK